MVHVTCDNSRVLVRLNMHECDIMMQHSGGLGLFSHNTKGASIVHFQPLNIGQKKTSSHGDFFRVTNFIRAEL